ncbi:XTP3-transactivated B protein [Thecamonas trahens ATCC 50062]|uniref:XTP3-transactivated B protein n=1 Tax=Thecamonas trahens ATCC 50062 TaxID=461836 RepID=A0A0L0DRG5_THETB|nr:XTP3-transactivated B protein [Thecamonas trahens ATCC 50062]KNC54880.1 XTP3-transactivated B protein [Thecamonas trahens ATCC 50062]|eukprot:XP_013753475.1 XTP3-transactivated B protein [Thecamonas trahens ATCC 50062]
MILAMVGMAACGGPLLPLLDETKFRVGLHAPGADLLLTSVDGPRVVAMTGADGRKLKLDGGGKHKLDDSGKASEAELLAPLLGECLYRVDGWWTYEVCYGSHVRQYHRDPKTEAVTAEFFLGRAPRSDRADAAAKSPAAGKVEADPASAAMPPARYVEKYDAGTPCDLTGEPRVTSLSFECSLTGLNAISTISEPATCTYAVTLSTPLLCDLDEYAARDEPELDILCVPKTEPLTLASLFAASNSADSSWHSLLVRALDKITAGSDAPQSQDAASAAPTSPQEDPAAASSDVDVVHVEDLLASLVRGDSMPGSFQAEALLEQLLALTLQDGDDEATEAEHVDDDEPA